ncbi:MAG: hypothetical protein GY696_05115 [Gammaproteobacteria bacterium]|nr:hypothetical protein [Gammaproteobacteria bacterium]
MRIPLLHNTKKDLSKTITLKWDDQVWLDRFTGAARSVPWQFTLAELAWTAGPVTFLAASLGYYLGFGESIPEESVRFFVAYTVVAGVVGLVARIVSKAVYGERRKREERDLLEVADRLPDLLFSVRDLQLAALEPEIRRFEAAGFLLQRVEMDPHTMILAVEDLGGSREMCELAAKIEIYRINGLYSRMEGLIAETSEQVRPMIEALSEKTPRVADLLRDRFNGRAPSLNEGIPRDTNFLERTLAATEQENMQLMTLHDVEEVLLLACELVNGRSIPMLLFTYRGRWELVDATTELEKRRNLYRIASTTVLSRLKALVAIFGENQEMDAETGPRGLTTGELLNRAMEGLHEINNLAEEVGSDLNTGGEEARKHLRQILNTLRSALKMTDAMDSAIEQMGQRHAKFLRSLEKWERSLSARDELKMVAPDRGHRGLQVVEQRIELEDVQRLKLSTVLVGVLRDYGIQVESDRILCRKGGLNSYFTPDIAKSLAMDVVAALQPFVDISRPEVQRAIDASNAANLFSLGGGLSARTKAAWSASCVQEVEDDLAGAAEWLAATLVNRYGVDLTEDAVEFLHARYGARLGRLNLLSCREGKEFTSPVSSLLTRPPSPLVEDSDWRLEVKRGRSLVKRYKV